MGSLIFDARGNLYGTTSGGGPDRTGTVFELSRTAGGAWTETVLWSFPSDHLKGFWPYGSLAIDPNGNLYGTTQYGGANFQGCNCGTVFELVKPFGSSISWREKVLHSFSSVANDGLIPARNLVFHGGSLYGATTRGGTNKLGTVFEFTRQSGTWTENILYNFSGPDGSEPEGISVDPEGNLFGVTLEGGGDECDCGVIYELSRPAVQSDPWTESVLFKFGELEGGGHPFAALTRDAAGNFFGTDTTGGGSDKGAVFELTPPSVSDGRWTLKPLHNFAGGGVVGDGANPIGGLVEIDGIYYGTTVNGGLPLNGTVYSIKP